MKKFYIIGVALLLLSVAFADMYSKRPSKGNSGNFSGTSILPGAKESMPRIVPPIIADRPHQIVVPEDVCNATLTKSELKDAIIETSTAQNQTKTNSPDANSIGTEAPRPILRTLIYLIRCSKSENPGP